MKSETISFCPWDPTLSDIRMQIQQHLWKLRDNISEMLDLSRASSGCHEVFLASQHQYSFHFICCLGHRSLTVIKNNGEHSIVAWKVAMNRYTHQAAARWITPDISYDRSRALDYFKTTDWPLCANSYRDMEHGWGFCLRGHILSCFSQNAWCFCKCITPIAFVFNSSSTEQKRCKWISWLICISWQLLKGIDMKAYVWNDHSD